MDDDKISSENHTIPHLETVAGVACARLSTSNTILTLLGIASLSPDGSVSSLLSSSTEFRFSTQLAVKIIRREESSETYEM